MRLNSSSLNPLFPTYTEELLREPLVIKHAIFLVVAVWIAQVLLATVTLILVLLKVNPFPVISRIYPSGEATFELRAAILGTALNS